MTTQKDLSAPQLFSKVIVTGCVCKDAASLLLQLRAAPAASTPPREAGAPAEGRDCVLFQGVRSVSSMSVAPARNRKLFSHLIHIMDKMRN